MQIKHSQAFSLIRKTNVDDWQSHAHSESTLLIIFWTYLFTLFVLDTTPASNFVASRSRYGLQVFCSWTFLPRILQHNSIQTLLKYFTFTISQARVFLLYSIIIFFFPCYYICSFSNVWFKVRHLCFTMCWMSSLVLLSWFQLCHNALYTASLYRLCSLASFKCSSFMWPSLSASIFQWRTREIKDLLEYKCWTASTFSFHYIQWLKHFEHFSYVWTFKNSSRYDQRARFNCWDFSYVVICEMLFDYC